MTFLLRTWYGLIGLIGRIVYYFMFRIPEIKASKMLLSIENPTEEQYEEIDNIQYHGMGQERYSEVVRECSDYRDEKIAEIKTQMGELHNDDLIDLNSFYFIVKFISISNQ